MIGFLLLNWRLFAILGAVIALLGAGEHLGASRIQDAWDASLLKQQQEALADRARIEASANQKTAEYEASAKKAKADLATLKRSLANVIAKDVNLAGCNATAEFLQIYRGVAESGVRPASR